ncbi:MAG: hypothetical protein HKN25_09365 [Pyrinomonadaceae bacterium]|nr:hypothetical protein [Pyrinomonadaceae bacterium]
MAIKRDSLSRKLQSKADKMTEIEEQIEKLDDDVRRLKIEFDIYFNGGTKAPPHQSRASLEARIKRLNGNRDLSYARRYRLNSLISKYTAYRELWRRRLKAQGDDFI